ncbi:MAG: serine/threonine-protein kinase, partial [Candidatus Eiseniibacteriota bacterium]
LTPSPSLAERFVREARTIAQLEHPNTVPIYKVGGYKNEVLFIVMRCVDGPSLRELLATYKRLSVGDAARIARQVADALAHAHSRGVVHRDVKPDNILLDQSGHVLVTDFGIAKAAQAASAGTQLTTEGMIIGTPQYMSPEQAAGEALDGRSDIYSLGIVLYQMLAGAPPFDGDSSAAILAKQLTATPAPIRHLRSDVSAALAAVIERMLAKDPAERFQRAADVSRALVEALPTAARDRVKVPLRRHLVSVAVKSLVGLGAVGCLAFVAFVAGAVVVIQALLSEEPRISARAPHIPDSVVVSLRAAGAVPRGDTLVYVFAPHGASARDALIITDRHVIELSSAGPRRYARGGVEVRYGITFGVRKRLHGAVVLIAAGGRHDTVFAELSPRELYELGRALAALEPADSARAR